MLGAHDDMYRGGVHDMYMYMYTTYCMLGVKFEAAPNTTASLTVVISLPLPILLTLDDSDSGAQAENEPYIWEGGFMICMHRPRMSHTRKPYPSWA